MNRDIRREALLTLHGRGAILDVAREVSGILRARGIDGAVVGGVAVVLHGYVRTTIDVDVFTTRAEELVAALRERGFAFDPQKRELVKDSVPVHIVTLEQLGAPPGHTEERDGILVVSLADLIDMKLRSGTRRVTRAQDLADVVELIRANGLTPQFAARLRRDMRAEFRKLVRAIRDDEGSAGS